MATQNQESNAIFKTMDNVNTIFLCSQFWTDFLPNFTSTVFGLLLGLPLAFWTNRKFTNAQDNQKQKEQKLRLENALKIIRQTLTENNARLQITVATINSGKVQFDIQLDISAWDAVKDDIAEHLHDPNLKKRIAYHFSRLNTMAKLNGMYLDFSAGIGAALGGVETTRDALKSNLLATAGFLSTDIAEILPLIDAKLTNK